uniref:Uncharacterized protein TCIL3000_11_460 n=1 Tax=Trypanosoma congolense (strain IL3000) TaxID=1068625 RepID=G0UZ47_TRYCI|nr:unnamed protein product [Trypanosoma congolense IL3000]
MYTSTGLRHASPFSFLATCFVPVLPGITSSIRKEAKKIKGAGRRGGPDSQGPVRPVLKPSTEGSFFHRLPSHVTVATPLRQVHIYTHINPSVLLYMLFVHHWQSQPFKSKGRMSPINSFPLSFCSSVPYSFCCGCCILMLSPGAISFNST